MHIGDFLRPQSEKNKRKSIRDDDDDTRNRENCDGVRIVDFFQLATERTTTKSHHHVIDLLSIRCA